MGFFNNLKISAKLLTGFIIVALIAGVVGVIGLVNLNNIAKEDTLLYEENTLGVDYAGNASIYYQRVRYNALKMTTVKDIGQRDDCIKKISEYILYNIL
jgi:methyl-accepting chemotaxis protein